MRCLTRSRIIATAMSIHTATFRPRWWTHITSARAPPPADFSQLGASGPQRASRLGQNMTSSRVFRLRTLWVQLIRAVDEILITQLDHEANRGPWLLLREKGAIVRRCHCFPTGALDYGAMRQLITSRTRIPCARLLLELPSAR